MRIYLDVCCLNRPFDDQTVDRNHLESEAVLVIVERTQQKEWTWVSSDAVLYEINKTPSDDRREQVRAMESCAAERVELNHQILQSARSNVALGFSSYDALHLAFAAAANVDVFLTTDDNLIKRARLHSEEIGVTVANPLLWVQEEIG